MMSNLRITLLLVAFIVISIPVFANEAVGPATSVIPTAVKAKRPSTEVVALVNNAPDAALEKLNFVELYFLKNAVMANAGYSFAEDRPWLKAYFAVDAKIGLRPCKSKDNPETCRIMPICAQGCKTFDLSQFDFPVVTKDFAFQMTPAMNSAMARIRQAQFKKLRTLSDGKQIQSKVDSDLKALPSFYGVQPDDCEFCDFGYPFALGRPVTDTNTGGGYSNEPERNVFEESLVRDLKGDLSLISLIDQFKQDKYEFDLAELLGLYLGNLDLLRKVILARSGRTFEEPLKTELKQMGVEAAGMSVGNLSAEAKEAIRKLDLAIDRLAKGQLNDLPESLKVKALDLDNVSLSYSGAM